ncbi:SRPBCC family protein [Spirillospora sp. CA-255316]
MELDHEFTVPVPVDQAWSVLLDVERVASCMPGAALDSVEGEEYSGRMKVKVGAMTITYRGTARITSADEAARTVTLEAAAKEARGSGTASATVVSQLHDEGDTTRVTVKTKLNVTGRPAQFGRNILSEVGGRLISRFATALAEELESPSAPAEAPGEVAGAGAAASAVEQSAAPAPAEEPAASEEPFVPKVPQQRPASPVETTASGPVVSPIRPRRDDPDDAIDLLEVAGPSLVKRAVPAAGAVVVVLLLIRFVLRRRRR